MAKTAGGIRKSSLETKRIKVANSKEFSVFANIVRKSKNVDEAFKAIGKINTVPAATSQKFFDVFANSSIAVSPKTAFENFYKSVKK